MSINKNIKCLPFHLGIISHTNYVLSCKFRNDSKFYLKLESWKFGNPDWNPAKSGQIKLPWTGKAK